jgi:hypothetical protein
MTKPPLRRGHYKIFPLRASRQNPHTRPFLGIRHRYLQVHWLAQRQIFPCKPLASLPMTAAATSNPLTSEYNDWPDCWFSKFGWCGTCQAWPLGTYVAIETSSRSRRRTSSVPSTSSLPVQPGTGCRPRITETLIGEADLLLLRQASGPFGYRRHRPDYRGERPFAIEFDTCCPMGRYEAAQTVR